MIDNPRVRLALAEHGRKIAVVLAIVAAVALVLTVWTVATPGTETVRERTDVQRVDAELSHSAVIQAEDAPWEPETELQDHPAYLLNASPRLDLALETDAPPGTTVVHDVRLELRVVREGAVVWENVTPLATEERTVANSSALTHAGIDVEEHLAERRQLQAEFQGVGTVESRILADARYDTGSYEGTLSTAAPLSVTGRAYWLSGDASASDAHSGTRTISREAPVDWSTVWGLVAVGLLALVGAVGAATYRVEADIEFLRQELHRQRFDDWISDGSIPMGVGSEYIALDSLKDAVDVAIDTNQRVVYDDRRDVFAVISDEVVYYYSRDGDWNRIAWPQAEREDTGPSFLDAFGMGDEDVPEVEATPPAEGGVPPEPGPGGPPGTDEGGAEFEPDAFDDAAGPGADAVDDASDEEPFDDEPEE